MNSNRCRYGFRPGFPRVFLVGKGSGRIDHHRAGDPPGHGKGKYWALSLAHHPEARWLAVRRTLLMKVTVWISFAVLLPGNRVTNADSQGGREKTRSRQSSICRADQCGHRVRSALLRRQGRRRRWRGMRGQAAKGRKTP